MQIALGIKGYFGFQPLMQIEIVVQLLLLLWSYFSVVLADPGSVPPNWRPAADEEKGETDQLNDLEFNGLQPDTSNQRIRYCRKYNHLKPPRCHHCLFPVPTRASHSQVVP
ncbi:cytokinesis-related Sec1 family protein [Hibiscus syriacus]|uniref:Cytokinesis-related Sec1 family protein n=1 Tax=Hibiscus syriacus TaxID=106335 RepID=A0A6A2WMY9_HIBSY|nr:cytokinesis-related Sec1 family protein [Hibiscus syriacus]